MQTGRIFVRNVYRGKRGALAAARSIIMQRRDCPKPNLNPSYGMRKWIYWENDSLKVNTSINFSLWALTI